MTLAPQHTLTRGLAALILTASTLAACSADTEETVSSSGGCEGPDITVEPSTAAPGDTVTVHGTAFRTDCYDHMVPGQTAGPAEPMPPFQLRLDDGTDVQDIALAEPDDKGRSTSPSPSRRRSLPRRYASSCRTCRTRPSLTPPRKR